MSGGEITETEMTDEEVKNDPEMFALDEYFFKWRWDFSWNKCQKKWITVWACSQIRLFISTTCSQLREHTVVSFVVENVKWQAVVGVEDRHIVFYQRSYVIALNQFI